MRIVLFLEIEIIKTIKMEENEERYSISKSQKRTVAHTVSSSCKMVKCVAPGWKSGYDSDRYNDKKEGISGSLSAWHLT